MSEIADIITPYRHQVGGPVSALRAVVTEQGFIDPSAEAAIADLFNISRAEVRGIVSFYTDLKTSPPAVKTIRICQAEACQAVGARKLTREFEDRFGIQLGQSTEDNQVALEAVYCLGLCANGPAAMVNDELFVETDINVIGTES